MKIDGISVILQNKFNNRLLTRFPISYDFGHSLTTIFFIHSKKFTLTV